MLWRVSPPLRSRLKPAGFILPCQPALADRPPSGPGWLHEIKFDGYRVIARKDGERVRLWARTTSDYSNTFTRIRDAVAALPVDSAVLDGEAVVFRSDTSSAFEALKSRHGQAEAVLVAYDIMEVDGQDVRPEPLEERRKRLAKRLSRRKVMPIFPPAKGTPGYRTEGLPPFEPVRASKCSADSLNIFQISTVGNDTSCSTKTRLALLSESVARTSRIRVKTG